MNNKKSYKEILKSSSVMGGAAGFVMIFGLFRTKMAALLIGTTGVGLIASFTAVHALASTLSGLGLNSSAVREIAAAAGKNDQQAINRSVCILRRLSILLGITGLLLLIVAARGISNITFGTDEYALDIAALGIAVCFGNLSSANMSILQGLRQVGDMARMQTYSAGIGTLFALPFYYLLGLRGIVPLLIVISIIQYIFSRYFVEKHQITQANLSWNNVFKEGKTMIGLGFTFMWSALLVSLVGYTTIYLINRFESIQMVGVYSAAFALSGIFVGFVLNAMSADYYPRLTALANDQVGMRQLVTQQTEIGILLALPGLLASIIFAPWLVKGLYTNEFIQAVPMLQWFIIGCLGRVISWPMGFVMLALGKDRWFLAAETIFNFVYIAAIAFALGVYGINGIAIAFCAIYVAHTMAMYIVCKKLIGFNANADYKKLAFGATVLLGSGLLITRVLDETTVIVLGALLVTASLAYSLRGFIGRTGNQTYLAMKIQKIPVIKNIVGL